MKTLKDEEKKTGEVGEQERKRGKWEGERMNPESGCLKQVSVIKMFIKVEKRVRGKEVKKKRKEKNGWHLRQKGKVGGGGRD